MKRRVFVDYALRPKRRLVDLYPVEAALFADPTASGVSSWPRLEQPDVLWLLEACLKQLFRQPRPERQQRRGRSGRLRTSVVGRR